MEKSNETPVVQKQIQKKEMPRNTKVRWGILYAIYIIDKVCWLMQAQDTAIGRKNKLLGEKDVRRPKETSLDDEFMHQIIYMIDIYKWYIYIYYILYILYIYIIYIYICLRSSFRGRWWDKHPGARVPPSWLVRAIVVMEEHQPAAKGRIMFIHISM